jgi:hypothetical protein
VESITYVHSKLALTTTQFFIHVDVLPGEWATMLTTDIKETTFSYKNTG